MTLDTNTLILAGVLAHLLAAVGKALFKAPRRQAQIDSIEGKVDAVIGQVAALVPPSAPAPNNGGGGPPAPDNGGAGEKTSAQGGQ